MALGNGLARTEKGMLVASEAIPAKEVLELLGRYFDELERCYRVERGEIEDERRMQHEREEREHWESIAELESDRIERNEEY